MSARKSKKVETSSYVLIPINTVYDLSLLGKDRTNEVYAWLKGKKPSKFLHEAVDVLGFRNPQWLQFATKGDLRQNDKIWAGYAEMFLGSRFPKIGTSEYFVRYLDALSIAKRTPKADFEGLTCAYLGYLVHMENLVSQTGVWKLANSFGVASTKDLADAKTAAEDYFVQREWESRLKTLVGS